MNEIRELLVGIDLGKEFSQICYYDRKADEPMSISMKAGTSHYEAPSCLCRKAENGEWNVGIEAEYFARERGGFLVKDLLAVGNRKEKIPVGEESFAPEELLAEFLRGMLKFLGIAEITKNMKCLVITVEELTSQIVKNLQSALKSLGFRHSQTLLMDYGESFYYYALGQKKETWNRNVGWYAFAGNQVKFRKLTMNVSTKPVLVELKPPVEIFLEEEDGKRDDQYCEFINETIGNDLYSSILLTGEGFDQKWAVKSTGALCRQKRKVFWGNNLFAKGACYGAKEKLENKKLKGYLYLSNALVQTNIGMEMMIMGSPAYYPLIEAGNNWYECKAECEFLLDEKRELVFLVSRMGEKGKKKVAMSLPGLPVRPAKATRIRLKLEYVSREECIIQAEDLGFGEMFLSGRKVWTETMRW